MFLVKGLVCPNTISAPHKKSGNCLAELKLFSNFANWKTILLEV